MLNFLKNRFTISAISFALVLAALIILMVIPAIQEIKIINNQVHDERLRLELLYEKGQVKAMVQKNYLSIKQDAKFLENILSKESQELEYISAVENIAQSHGIEIAMSAGKVKRTPEQRFSELEFTFTLAGKWENILKWINGVENLSQYTNMKEMSVSIFPDKINENIRKANVTISADTFWLLPNN